MDVMMPEMDGMKLENIRKLRGSNVIITSDCQK
jgi:CheY-like chemotaxis protein